tara:strand:- start:1086 stop:1271 length:186 start_codon:yes stop_codon:yes gene_type:complete
MAKPSLLKDLRCLRLEAPPKHHKALAAAVTKAWPPGPKHTLQGWGWEQVRSYQRLSAWLAS